MKDKAFNQLMDQEIILTWARTPQYTNYEGLHCFYGGNFRFAIQGL